MLHRYGFGGPEEFRIVLGEHNRTERTSKSQRKVVQIEVIITHPEYTGLDVRSKLFWRNDVALIKLDQCVDFSPYIQPICLPADDSTDDIVNCWTTGWGRPYSESRDFFC